VANVQLMGERNKREAQGVASVKRKGGLQLGAKNRTQGHNVICILSPRHTRTENKKKRTQRKKRRVSFKNMGILDVKGGVMKVNCPQRERGRNTSALFIWQPKKKKEKKKTV